MAQTQVESESLKDEMRNTIEEARMVIPGAQALFGFQTMAVFNQRFEDLATAGRAAYLAGLAMLAISIALLMAPAALHRMSERGRVSRRLVEMSSRLLTWGMVPLALALAFDVFVVVLAVLGEPTPALASGLLALAVFIGLWFALPLWRRSHP